MAVDEAIYPYRFSVLGYERAERFEAWRAEHRHHDISRRMRDVEIRDANFRGIHLDELALGRWRLVADPVAAEARLAQRTLRKIRRDQLDHFYLRLALSDSWLYRVGAAQVEVGPGQLALVDLGQPYELSIASGEVLMLMVPRDRLPLATAGLHGAVLDHGLGRLFADHLRALFERAGRLSANERPAAAAVTLDFLRAALSGVPNALAQAQREIDATLLERVRAHIDQHLDSPTLRVDSICAQVGLSRSRLYRLFEPIGGVAAHIRQRRLAHIRAALLAGIAPRPLIADLAFRYGFSSPAQLTRAFRREYGCAPSEAGAEAMDDAGPQRWLQPR
ncbi:MAG: helix-turn-helix domain-containing protein [Pelomonas sp.]|nr:helix-turn-helix domain-containing protein [Roseateles sp.]